MRPRPPMPSVMPRPVMVRAFDLLPGMEVDAHSHSWGQLAYASEGIMIVSTPEGSWTVPPARAVWIPPGVEHAISIPGSGAFFRSVYTRADHSHDLGPNCRVLRVTSLLRELIIRASEMPLEYDEDGPEGRLMTVIVDQIREMREEEPLYLPMPRDRRLLRLAQHMVREPGVRLSLEEAASQAGASARTIARRFTAETGLTFGEWQRRLSLVTAVERLATGQPVTAVALDLGYESPSAFIAMFRRTLGASPTAFLARA